MSFHQGFQSCVKYLGVKFGRARLHFVTLVRKGDQTKRTRANLDCVLCFVALYILSDPRPRWFDSFATYPKPGYRSLIFRRKASRLAHLPSDSKKNKTAEKEPYLWILSFTSSYRAWLCASEELDWKGTLGEFLVLPA
jgi:hypothetical protein